MASCQRAAIARAVVHEPALLVADEPTGNLDSDNGARVLDLLAALNRDAGVTILLATHSQELAAAADDIVHLRDGRVESIDDRSAKVRRWPCGSLDSSSSAASQQERMRTAVAVGGIALGVAVVLAIRLANQSSVSGFASALDAMSGAASLEIVAPAGGIDEQRLAQLDWLSEFGAVSPVIEGDVVARPSQGGARGAARARGRYSARPGVPRVPA